MFFLFAIDFSLRFPELSLMGNEQILQIDSIPLFWRPSSPWLAEAGLLERSTGLFCFCDDFHVHIPAVIKGFQLLKSRHSKEIPIQQKQGIPKSKGSLVSILHHLDHMGSS